MEKEKLSYAQAVEEIEEILARMNDNELDIDQLGTYVERATSLITMCKNKLLKAQKQVDKVMKTE